MNTDSWSFDQQTGIVKHANGLIVEINNGEVVEIQGMPKGISTRELPGLLEDAVKASQSAGKPSESPGSNKPKRPVLSLKK